MTEFIHLFILLIGGIAGGLYASSVGGEGLFTLPVLLLIGLPIHLAIGTQRFAAVILELASAIKFHREKKINFKLALPLGLIAGLGSFIGANLVISINDKYLNVITGVLLLGVFLIR